MFCPCFISKIYGNPVKDPMRLMNVFNLPSPSSLLGPEVCSASNRNEYQRQKNYVSGE
jgi:hypothetical protein